MENGFKSGLIIPDKRIDPKKIKQNGKIKKIIGTRLTYLLYAERDVLDDKGNLSLYADNSQQIYTIIDGNKIFFRLPEAYVKAGFGPNFTKNWWGSDWWDLHAAEREKNFIKLITRSKNTLFMPGEWLLKRNFFEVLSFDTDGNFIDKEVTGSGERDHDTSHPADAKRLRKLGIRNWSPLEEWAIKNKDLLTEEETRNGENTRVEEWAYYKYKELYPKSPMLAGFGVEVGTKKADNSSNKESLYAPSRFKVKYIDKITNFNPSTDTLEVDMDSFGVNSSATFAAGKNNRAVKKKLASKDFDFLYDKKKGGLYFNENGADKGFGDGGIIAILKGAPDLSEKNIDFI